MVNFLRINITLMQGICLAAFLIPIIIYWTILFQYSVNIPIVDDFDSIYNYINNNGAFGSLKSIFSQHNEHRIVFNRIITALLIGLTGHADLRLLIYIGNFSLFVVLGILVSCLKKIEFKYLYLLPVSFILLQLQAWDNMTWATTALQNNWVLAFASLAFYFWSKKSPLATWLAIFLGIAAGYTSFSGLLVLPVFILWEINAIGIKNIISLNIKKYLTLRLSIAFIATVLLYSAYFIDYTFAIDFGNMSEKPFSIRTAFIYFIMLIGAPLEYFGSIVVVIYGLLVTIFLGHLTYNKYYIRRPVLYYFIIYLIGCLFLISIGRSRFDIATVFSSRYKIIPIIIQALVYLIFLDIYRISIVSKKCFAVVLILVSMFAYLYSFSDSMYSIYYKKTALVKGIKQWMHTGVGLVYPDQEYASICIIKAHKKGYWRFLEHDTY